MAYVHARMHAHTHTHAQSQAGNQTVSWNSNTNNEMCSVRKVKTIFLHLEIAYIRAHLQQHQEDYYIIQNMLKTGSSFCWCYNLSTFLFHLVLPLSVTPSFFPARTHSEHRVNRAQYIIRRTKKRGMKHLKEKRLQMITHSLRFLPPCCTHNHQLEEKRGGWGQASSQKSICVSLSLSSPEDSQHRGGRKSGENRSEKQEVYK